MMPFSAKSLLALTTLLTTASALTGDTQCSRAFCVSAFVNSTSSVTYKLTVSRPTVGWMALGYGSNMIGSPMVLLYTNSTGQTVVSQRQAISREEPPVDTQPDRVAFAYDSLKSLGSGSTTMAFTIPTNGDQRQSVIWAYSATPPSAAGRIVEHDDKGTLSLNLANNLDSSNPSTTAPSGSSSTPLTYNQKLIAAHGIILTVAFFFVLPVGVLIARLGRTFTPSWIKGHQFFQGGLAGILIVAGFVLAVVEVSNKRVAHFSTGHKRIGLVVFVLYLLQVSLGAIIHRFKPTQSYTSEKHPAARRPVQNYLHALLGLTILGLSFYQIYTGFNIEWPNTQDMAPFGTGVHIFYTVWVVVIFLAYVGGLVLLRRQFAQERSYHATQAGKLERTSS